MRHPRSFVCLLLVLIACATLVAPAGAKGSVYSTGFVRWRAATGGLAGWDLSGANIAADGTLQLNPATAQTGSDVAGGYYGRNFYNGGSFLVGEALSPVTPTGFGFFQAIASWNASTPPGTWIETQIRARLGDRLTKWYNLGVWAADYSTIERHSVNLQGDADGFVAVDTLVLTDKKVAGTAFQLKVRLFKDIDGTAIPSVRNMAVALSTTPEKPSSLTPGNPALWNRTLAVPECSQMVYPNGGEVWCSPTSTSMVLGYWGDTGDCAARVHAAVDGVFDWVYDGHGNWPFNTAYAATHNLEGYVARFTSMAQAEPWIASGVPVVISYAWKKSDLTGAPIPSSGGHLAVLVGFDAAGNPVVNDPAAASDEAVQRTYLRAELESLWLEHSGGTVYLIYPPDHPVPDF